MRGRNRDDSPWRGAGAFAADFPNVAIVPRTTGLTFEVPALWVRLDPDDGNGFDRTNWAIARAVKTAPKLRIVKETEYSISAPQVVDIRARTAEPLGWPTA